MIRPMLATLSKAVVTGDEWVFEEKYDGIRVIAERRGTLVRLSSRTGQDLTAGFAAVADAIRALPDDDLTLDGELVIFDARGTSRFQLLQRRGTDPRLRPVYVAFDCLRSQGKDLTRATLERRRERLLALVPRRSGALMPSRQLRGDGQRALEVARERGWEGVIAKLRGSRYEPGSRSQAWRKLKVRGESEFVVGGYTAPSGARAHLGALLVGLYDGATLRFTGKVGTGYTQQALRELAAKLDRLRTDRAPFDPAPRMRDVTWVRPALVAQVAYAEWTADGRLRQPAFLGLRDDKKPRECTWRSRE